MMDIYMLDDDHLHEHCDMANWWWLMIPFVCRVAPATCPASRLVSLHIAYVQNFFGCSNFRWHELVMPR